VLLLALYDAGEQVGEYNSAGTSTLTARQLSRAFRVPLRTAIIWALLRSPRFPLFLIESFRHRLLVRCLGHPSWASATGYRYILKGEPPEDLRETDLLHVGGPPLSC
jgi:hypothetical protein